MFIDKLMDINVDKCKKDWNMNEKEVSKCGEGVLASLLTDNTSLFLLRIDEYRRDSFR
jgi:hypothetical protein